MKSINLVNIENVSVCGERINPTGKKKLKEAILNENYDYLINEAVKQAECGADILDVNVGVPKIVEAKIMKNAVCMIQEYCDLPLQIDSSNKEAIELGCRYYNGIPIINPDNIKQNDQTGLFSPNLIDHLCIDEDDYIPYTNDDGAEKREYNIDYRKFRAKPFVRLKNGAGYVVIKNKCNYLENMAKYLLYF